MSLKVENASLQQQLRSLDAPGLHHVNSSSSGHARGQAQAGKLNLDGPGPSQEHVSMAVPALEPEMMFMGEPPMFSQGLSVASRQSSSSNVSSISPPSMASFSLADSPPRASNQLKPSFEQEHSVNPFSLQPPPKRRGPNATPPSVSTSVLVTL